jgi:hypothetical protein
MRIDSKATPVAVVTPKRRTREELLQDIEDAIARERSYGREVRARGANPYDSHLGSSQDRDVWGSRRRPA